MRKILFFYFLIVSNFSFAQIENFSAANGQVFWRKIYKSSKSLGSIKLELESRNNLKIVQVTDSTIVGEISNLIMDYKRAGFSYMLTPMILNESNKYVGLFKLEVKENRYRASIWNVSSKGMNMTSYGSGLALGSDLSSTIEEILLRKGTDEFRNNFYKTSGKIIDVTFSNLMDFTGLSKNNNNW